MAVDNVLLTILIVVIVFMLLFLFAVLIISAIDFALAIRDSWKDYYKFKAKWGDKK